LVKKRKQERRKGEKASLNPLSGKKREERKKDA